MNQTVYSKQKNPANLGNLFAKGGEAEVYELNSRKDVLVKIYHKQKLNKQLQEKIECITDQSKYISLFEDDTLSWPKMAVYDSSGSFIGYAMKKGSGKTLFNWKLDKYKKHFPNINRKHIVRFLINYLEKIQKLHDNNIFIGDYSLKNILLDPINGKFMLIDCDSYQVKTSSGKVYYCPVGSEAFIPKEHQGRSFIEVERTLESELFSIATVLFMILMLGQHPYTTLNSGAPSENIKKSNFPYELNKRGSLIPKGKWAGLWDILPNNIKILFIQCFKGNLAYKRVAIKEWIKELKIYYKGMNDGVYISDVVPANIK